MSHRQFVLEAGNFLTELIDDLDFRIDVHGWLVRDEGRLHGVVQGAQVFFDVGV